MARRRTRRYRRYSSRIHRYSNRHASGIGKVLGPAAFLFAGISQLIAKDVAPGASTAAAFSNTNTVGKAKFIANDVMGRVIGISPFPDQPQFTQTINPAGIMNKTTGIGLGLLIYNKVGGSFGLPKIVSSSIAKNIFKGGVIGGFFDAPNSSGTSGYAAPLNNNSGSAPSGLSSGGI